MDQKPAPDSPKPSEQPSEFGAFKSFLEKLVAVPKEEIDRKEAVYKKKKAAKKKKPKQGD